MNPAVMVVLMHVITAAPTELADVEKVIAAVGADKDILSKVKDILQGGVKCLEDLGA